MKPNLALRVLVAAALGLAVPDGSNAEDVSPKEQVEALMNEGLPFAEQMLREHGEFYPYAYAMTNAGEIQAIGTSVSTERPKSLDVIATLEGGLAQRARDEDIKAIAVFVDVLVTPPGQEKTDAVSVSLEHRSGYCVEVIFPYIRGEDGSPTFGELYASAREGAIFSCR